jgi:hypothetical protein
MGRTEAEVGTGVLWKVWEVSIKGRGWAEQRQELAPEFLGQFGRSVPGAEDGQNRGGSWYRSSWVSLGGQYQGQRMGRTETGVDTGVPGTVQEVSTREQRMGITETGAGTGVPGQFRRSVSGAEDGQNRDRSWYRSSWNSSGGQYQGQRMGRPETGASTGVPGTVQGVSIRGRGWAEKRQELVQEFLVQFRRSVSGGR